MSRVRLTGSGRDVSYNSSFVANVSTVTFGSSCLRGCSLEHLTVQGCFNSNVSLVTTNALTVAQNIPVNNSWIMGVVNGIVSNGANWYGRCVFDTQGSMPSLNVGFVQGAAYAGATSLENSFVQCDFTGPFTEAIIDRWHCGNQCRHQLRPLRVLGADRYPDGLLDDVQGLPFLVAPRST